MVSIADMQRAIRGTIRISEPLTGYTSFRIGGSADFVVEPSTKEDVVAAVGYFSHRRVSFFIIGTGSNILVADQGYRGTVIAVSAALGEIRNTRDGCVEAGAGVRLSALVDFCVQQSLEGAEQLAGIPGSIGGALVMKRRVHTKALVGCLLEIEVLSEGKIHHIAPGDAWLTETSSGLNPDIVLSAKFRFPVGGKEELLRQRREILIARTTSRPVNFPTAGYVFKDPPGENASNLIERSIVKGLRQGGARISDLNANCIVNTGGATADDVFALIRKVQQTVRRRFGVSLELELKLVGFESAALRDVA